MALVRWDPWSEMLSMQRDMQDFLRRSFGVWQNPLRGTETTTWLPPIEVFGRDGDLVVRVELPGVNPRDDVEILLDGGSLVIRGERRREHTAEGGQWFRSEATYGTFERRIAVPDQVQDADIHATYTDGVLEVVVPKAVEMRQPKRIPVSTSTSANLKELAETASAN